MADIWKNGNDQEHVNQEPFQTGDVNVKILFITKLPLTFSFFQICILYYHTLRQTSVILMSSQFNIILFVIFLHPMVLSVSKHLSRLFIDDDATLNEWES